MRQCPTRPHSECGDSNSGFTLLELSIVLIIIALVTGMAVSAGISAVASARQAATINKMKTIDQALMAFRVANNRLPCPADLTITPGSTNFGIEAGGASVCTAATGVCKGATLAGTCIGTTVSPAANFTAAGVTYTNETAAEGALPVVTLGLPNDMVVDGWGNSFRYAVDTTMTELGAFHDNPVNNTCGAITIEDTNDAVRSSDAIYALISHGPNGHGAYNPYTGAVPPGNPVNVGSTNTNELLNCHCSTATGTDNGTYAATYVQALPTITTPGTTSTTFDDIVTYKERWQMATPWDPVATLYIGEYSNNRVRKVQGCTITTVAGNGTGAYAGDGGPATSAEIHAPKNIALDSSDNIYISDYYNYRIRKVTAATGIITTIAGNGTNSYSGDGGPATSAELYFPQGMALDSAGNLYFADQRNERIRKVTASTGIITTVAGNGTSGYSGDGGQATSAELNQPMSVVLDSSGNMYISDDFNARIRKVTAATGIITTVAGNGMSGHSGDGGPATSAKLNYPEGIALDSAGNIYIADDGNYNVRKVTASTGIITTVAGNRGVGYSGDGGPATSAELVPENVAVDSAGNIYIADQYNQRIRKVAASTGIITTVAGNGRASYSGDGGPATSASMDGPYGIAVVPWAAVSNR
jgi:prepilin-type N-terminal cleavage/methylation domain-containing protein